MKFLLISVCGLVVCLSTAPFSYLCAAAHHEEGIALLDQWQLDEAEQRIVKNQQGQIVEQPVNLYLASLVAFHRGQIKESRVLYDSAITHGLPPENAYQQVLYGTEKIVHDFVQQESAHFVVYYPPGKDAVLAEWALIVLEKVFKTIGTDLGVKLATGRKIAVFIVPDLSALAVLSTLPLHEIESSGTIAICKFNRLILTSPLSTYFGYHWADTLAHEFVHLVVNQVSLARVPIWLHEGLAKWYETRWRRPRGLFLGQYAYELIAKAARDSQFISFEAMHPSMAKLPNKDASALAFAEVVVAVSMLEEAAHASLRNILTDVAAGQSVEQAVSKAYQKPFEVFLKHWQQKLRGLAGLALGPHDKSAQDFRRLGELLHMNGRPRAAIIEYEKAYKIIKNKDAQLLNLYARAHFEVGASHEAEKHWQTLLTLYPDESDVPLKLARLSLSTQKFEQARSYFEQAVYINPFDVEIYRSWSAIDESMSVRLKKMLAILEQQTR